MSNTCRIALTLFDAVFWSAIALVITQNWTTTAAVFILIGALVFCILGAFKPHTYVYRDNHQKE